MGDKAQIPKPKSQRSTSRSLGFGVWDLGFGIYLGWYWFSGARRGVAGDPAPLPFWRTTDISFVAPSLTSMAWRFSAPAGSFTTISRVPIGTCTGANGATPTRSPSTHTSAPGVVVIRNSADGSGTVNGWTRPGRTVSVVDDRYPNRALTNSIR